MQDRSQSLAPLTLGRHHQDRAAFFGFFESVNDPEVSSALFETVRQWAVGRSLDFLCQEMNREINTIGSKANDAEVALAVVAVKSDLEKLREQIQNLE